MTEGAVRPWADVEDWVWRRRSGRRSDSTNCQNTRQRDNRRPRWRGMIMITRKLSYRKDDRAMRPTYGCPGNFRQSLTTPTANV